MRCDVENEEQEKKKMKSVYPCFLMRNEDQTSSCFGNAVILDPYIHQSDAVMFIDGVKRFEFWDKEYLFSEKTIVINSEFEPLNVMNWIIREPFLRRYTQQEFMDRDIAYQEREERYDRQRLRMRERFVSYELKDGNDRIGIIRDHISRETDTYVPEEIDIYLWKTEMSPLEFHDRTPIWMRDNMGRDCPYFVASMRVISDDIISICYLGFCPLRRGMMTLGSLQLTYEDAVKQREYKETYDMFETFEAKMCP